jgi:hypothetical protein
MLVLNTKNISSLETEVKRLASCKKKFEMTNRFIDRLTETVLTFSPPNAFPTDPTLKQIWKWLRRLIEEYMGLKKEKTLSSYG